MILYDVILPLMARKIGPTLAGMTLEYMSIITLVVKLVYNITLYHLYLTYIGIYVYNNIGSETGV